MKKLLCICIFYCTFIYSSSSQVITDFQSLIQHESYQQEVVFTKTSPMYPKGLENKTNGISDSSTDDLISFLQQQRYQYKYSMQKDLKSIIIMKKASTIKKIVFTRIVQEDSDLLSFTVTTKILAAKNP